ncbi:MAG: hypothetical protein CVV42_03000 [Candidatus Riflebacteria bacterium HGW-Riflebacteria-2]|jgi:hypothetical protein|nr:MAG: hypothetical protein CVV42_03000 [Candidatus Riflebacteria bacterium HGW-Riflebacteria-2]
MSLPHLEFQCSKCDFESTSLKCFGRRNYRCDESYIPVSSELGWCFRCKNIALIEAFPDEKEIMGRQNLLQVLVSALEKSKESQPSEIPWHKKLLGIKPKLPEEVKELQYKITALKQHVAEDLARLKLMRDRQSPYKCLICGEEKHVYLTNVEWKRLHEQTEAIPIGFKHPFCGGEILAGNSDIRFHFKSINYVYDKEGNFIEKADG